MSFKSSVFSSAMLLGSISLAGCAGHHSGEQALQQANSDFQAVKEDSNVLRIAPKDVIRAGESFVQLLGQWRRCGALRLPQPAL